MRIIIYSYIDGTWHYDPSAVFLNNVLVLTFSPNHTPSLAFAIPRCAKLRGSLVQMDNIRLPFVCRRNYAAVIPGRTYVSIYVVHHITSHHITSHHITSHHIHNLFCLLSHLIISMPFQIQNCHRQSPETHLPSSPGWCMTLPSWWSGMAWKTSCFTKQKICQNLGGSKSGYFPFWRIRSIPIFMKRGNIPWSDLFGCFFFKKKSIKTLGSLIWQTKKGSSNIGDDTKGYTPQNKHGTWKWTLGKGDSYWKPSFPGSMLIFGGVIFRMTPNSKEWRSN